MGIGLLLFTYLLIPLFRPLLLKENKIKEKTYIMLSYNKILYKTYKIKNKTILEGINAYETGYLEKAKLLFNAALTQRLNEYDRKICFVNLANVYDDLSQYDGALKYLGQAISLDKEDGIIYHNQGIIYKHKKDYQKAIESFRLAIKYNPRFIKSYLSLASLYFYIKDSKNALRYYKEAEVLSPNNDEIKFNSAVCLLNLNQYEEAEKALEKIISSESMADEIKAMSAKSLGTYFALKNDYERALFYYTKAISFQEDYDVYYKIGTIYKILGKFQESLDSFTKAYQLNNKNTMALRNLAELYYRFNEPEKALAYYHHLINMVKAESEIYLDMGEIYYQNGDIHNAITYYKKSLAGS